MKRKVYYLSSCTTCKRIMGELPLDTFEKQDIKSSPITTAQIENMKSLSGNYESLFSRVAMKYKSLGLKNKNLTEADYKNYILDEYTFLKRPVFIVGDQIFIGNAKKTIAALAELIQEG